MKKKYSLAIAVLLLIGIASSVFLWIKVKNQDIAFQKVIAVVSSVEKLHPIGYKGGMEYKVMVRRDGREKEVHNIRKGFQYYVGKMVEVVEADGVLYEDEDGVRTDTYLAYYYFASLAINLILLVLLITGVVSARRQ